MNILLKILQKNAKASPAEIAEQLSLTESEVTDAIKKFEANGTILGYHAVIDQERLEPNRVTAVIEVRVTPEREGGFDRIASRIARFDEVESVYLMSGGYDLLVVVEGQTLRNVAAFVANKLSTIEAVQSCATRFRLKTYKEHGMMHALEEDFERLAVSP
ncbi:MAG: Lrp/AsnC family transcriptional regulator [Chthoniobacterales bacterium]